MRPSRNAILGYSYQKTIAFLLLALMDVQREFEQIEIEAIVDHNFDDVKVVTSKYTLYCQMKDIDGVTLDNLRFDGDNISINAKKHILSSNKNVLFIKSIEFVPNSMIFGIPALLTNKVYIVSLSRDDAWNMMLSIYKENELRISQLEIFFDSMLDQRKLVFRRLDLPNIEIFSTELMDKTIRFDDIVLSNDRITHIVGKPGVGKSHLVNQLELERNRILYRFWISNQDTKYKDRLVYKNFLANISKELFNNLVPKTEEEIISKLRAENLILVIDGLDHVENYNPDEIEKFVDFIDKVGIVLKVIVLSRALKIETIWEKKVLNNWTFEQTIKFLDESYHIIEYDKVREIYRLTDGYPIIVNYIAKHYKQFEIIPSLEVITDLNEYYDGIIKNAQSKKALALFLTSRSFFMFSEIKALLEPYAFELIKEFIGTHPYLFEIRLNRVSLIHDSFNTYLYNQNIGIKEIAENVQKIVFSSIMNGEIRYLCRFNFFDLSKEMKINVLKKYADINQFKELMNGCIDFEAITSFYYQLRAVVGDVEPDFLELEEYYDLSLIFNMIHRDHTSSVNGFFYIYANTLIENEYSCEDITSTDYLFSFMYYILENDFELIRKIMSDDHYSIDNFYNIFNRDINQEDTYFEENFEVFKSNEETRQLLTSKMEYQIKPLIEKIMINSYIHRIIEPEFIDLYKAIKLFIDEEDINQSAEIVENQLVKYGMRNLFARSLLTNVRNKLESLGFIKEKNDYVILSFEEYIDKYVDRGSFDVLQRITNYMRLSLHEGRKIDIYSIGKFWTMYHERKDYSVISIPAAFQVFESMGLMSKLEACSFVINAQKISEKGIRTLLSEYIKMNDTLILKILEENFVLEDLNVDWFELPIEFIDSFSQNLFRVAMSRILDSYSVSREISINIIENALSSNKYSEIVYVLSITGYVIELPDKHPLIDILNKSGIRTNIAEKHKNEYGFRRDSAQRFSEGVIAYEDIEYVNSLVLSPFEVASYTNGFNMLLANIDLFSKYSTEDIQENIYRILQNAFLGRIKSINMYGDLYYFVGNLPELFFKNNIEVNWDHLYSSLKTFLELSSIKIEY